MNKHKILLVTNDFLVGGVQKLALDQLTHEHDPRYEFHLLVLMDFPGKGTFYDRIPPTIPVYRGEFRGFKDLRGWWRLMALLRRLRPEIVKTSLFFSNTVLRVLQPFFGYKVLAAEHNTEERRPYWMRLMNRLLAGRSVTMVTDSQTVARFLHEHEHIPQDRFTVVYNGIELDDIRQSLTVRDQHRERVRTELGIGPEERVLLNIARLSKQKDHRLLVLGFAEYLRRSERPMHVIIVGDGPLFAEIQSLVQQLGIARYVHLVGEQQDIYRFYHAADAFILSSEREGFCLSAMMGLAFGLPLLSTRVAGVIEYMKEGESGMFFDRDPQALADVIERWTLLSEEASARYRLEAQRVASGFGVDTYIRSYRLLYDQALGTRLH